MLEEPKFLSAEQFVLTTLVVKLAAMAALATMLGLGITPPGEQPEKHGPANGGGDQTYRDFDGLDGEPSYQVGGGDEQCSAGQ